MNHCAEQPHRMRWRVFPSKVTSWINHKTVHHYSLNYLSHLYWTCASGERRLYMNGGRPKRAPAEYVSFNSIRESMHERTGRHIDKLNTEMWFDMGGRVDRDTGTWGHQILTVRFPRFFTLHTKWTLLPTNPVIFDGMVVSKYGPVPGVGYSCRKSVRKRRELPSDDPKNSKKKIGEVWEKHEKKTGSINDNVYCGWQTFNFLFSFIKWIRGVRAKIGVFFWLFSLVCVSTFSHQVPAVPQTRKWKTFAHSKQNRKTNDDSEKIPKAFHLCTAEWHTHTYTRNHTLNDF